MSKRNNPYKTTIKNVVNLLERQDYKCIYCNTKITGQNATCEHIKAYSKIWKKHHNNNIAIACKRCNKLKWNISEQLFRDWYICVNIKEEFDWQSYNKAVKVRNKINWLQKTFPKIFNWNKKHYKLTYKLYE